VIGTSDLKKGVSVEVDGTLYQIVEVQHVKTKKSAVYRVKMRDLRGGHIIERSFNNNEKLAAARVERRPVQYLYGDGERFTFMNAATYEQMEVDRSLKTDALPFMKEGDTVQAVLYGDEMLGLELPAAVELRITGAEPGVKGDTATGATKAATLETGHVVAVPLFINAGDTIKVSTSTGGYIERVATG